MFTSEHSLEESVNTLLDWTDLFLHSGCLKVDFTRWGVVRVGCG